MKPPNSSSVDFRPGRFRLPPNFQLWPDAAPPPPLPTPPQIHVRVKLWPDAFPELLTPAWPATPPIPPTVASGDLITAVHENTVSTGINDLWIDLQWLAANSLVNPTTTAGDLIVSDGSTVTRLPIGADAQVLTTDLSLPLKVKWATPSTGGGGAGYVPTSRQIIAGPGLSGGGALTADVTLSAVPMSASGTGHKGGIVPDPGVTAGAGRFLCENATWAVPPGSGSWVPTTRQILAGTGLLGGGPLTNDVQLSAIQLTASGPLHSGGIAPDPGPTVGVVRFLREDATWAIPDTGSGTGGQQQTPWLSAIDAAGWALNNTGPVGIGTASESGVPLVVESLPGAGNETLQLNAADSTASLGLVLRGFGPECGLVLNTATYFATAWRSLAALYSKVDIGFLTASYPGDGASIERLRILASNGNVGIAQKTPAYKLDVTGDVNITGVYRINGVPITTGGGSQTPWATDIDAASHKLNNAASIGIGTAATSTIGVNIGSNAIFDGFFQLNSSPNGYAGLNLQNDAGHAISLRMYGTGRATPDIARIECSATLAIVMNNVESVRVTTGGSVGIGVTPAYKLDVNGDCNITGVYRINGVPITTGGGGTPAGSNGQVQFNNAGAFGASANLFWDNAAFRLGIGTATPGFSAYSTAARVLDVMGPGTLAGDVGVVTIGTNFATAAAGNLLGALDFYHAKNGSAVGDRLGGRIWSSLEGSGGTGGFGANLTFRTKADNGASVERVRINAAGLVGINCVPTALLHISKASAGFAPFSQTVLLVESAGSAAYVEAACKNISDACGYLFSSGSGLTSYIIDIQNQFQFVSSRPASFVIGGSERMRIITGGYVGIGVSTASPACPLEITHSGGATFGVGLNIKTVGGTDGPRIGFEIYNGGTPKSWNAGILQSGTSFVIAEDSAPTTGGFGAPRFCIAPGGFCGIGTLGPNAPLNIVYTGSVCVRLQGALSTVSNNTQLRFWGSGAAADLWAIGTDMTAGNGSTYFQVHNLTSGPVMTWLKSGNIGVGGNVTPSVRLSFEANLGDKIALYDGGTGQIYGMGIQGGLLQIYNPTTASRVGIGVGTSASFTETLTIRNGCVGVNIVSPNDGLVVNGLAGGGYGQIRMIAGGYGAFFRNDGATIYFMVTASGDQYGTWSTPYPWQVDLASKQMTISSLVTSGLTVNNNATINGMMTCVGVTASGDITTYRAGSPGTGVVYFSNQGNHYIYYDGTNFNITNTVYVSGSVLSNNVPLITGMLTQNNGSAALGPFQYFNFQPSAQITWSNTPGGPGNNTLNILAVYGTSDIRLKQNITPLEGGLPIIDQLRPVKAQWNGLGFRTAGQPTISVIAQDLQAIIPDAVYPFPSRLRPEDEEPTDLLSIDPMAIVSHLILAVQELARRINALESKPN